MSKLAERVRGSFDKPPPRPSHPRGGREGEDERIQYLTKERYLDIINLDSHFRTATFIYKCGECGHEWEPLSITEWKCPRCGDESGPIFDDYLEITTTSKAHIPKLFIEGKENGEPEYLLLFSNTDNAHSMGKTRDWVVVYAWWPEEEYGTKHTYTVVWANGSSRVIAGIHLATLPEEE